MEHNIEMISYIEAYLNDELPFEEKVAFEELRKEDPYLDQQVVAHRHLLKTLREYAAQKKLRAAIESMHHQANPTSQLQPPCAKLSSIKYFFKKHATSMILAASISVFIAFISVLLIGYLPTGASHSEYNALRRAISKKIINIERSQSAILKNMASSSGKLETPASYSGTGFALSANGCLVTNYHVIDGADSVYVQSASGESFKAKSIYTNKIYDIALLQIIDPKFKAFRAIPYSIKTSYSDLGEDVYTIGFSKDDPVYGKGYLSSSRGYADDSVAYQISIPVNPGNSGGPLLDNYGRIIGMISGKATKVEGVAFAIKSNYLLKAIQEAPDSLGHALILPKKNLLAGLSRKDQIKKLQTYVFMIKAY